MCLPVNQVNPSVLYEAQQESGMISLVAAVLVKCLTHCTLAELVQSLLRGLIHNAESKLSPNEKSESSFY